VIVLATVSLLPLVDIKDYQLRSLLSALVLKGRKNVQHDEQLPQQGNLQPNPRSSLDLYCIRHDITQHIFNSNEFKVASPAGGCSQQCLLPLDCGHNCIFPCHDKDLSHKSESYKCATLIEQVCKSGHKFMQECWNNKCPEVVLVHYNCGHFPSREMKCHEVS